jgi:hypothetical protein
MKSVYHAVWTGSLNKAVCASYLTLSLLMSYIYGAPRKARNLICVYIYIYGRDFLLGILLLEPCISLTYA